ncbi:Undecaprenyl-diphosphatase [Candidatus Saccharibacteria bacterium RAAC3_TM7_1]|nr:Undecaprenyl-diphosphatase [Candidatus Saccharibacteria bacterium RAAC3_TM7_1]HCZ28154.1 undecaprenyl-diphosphate phosphatase [Candidatus Saccharibacteria bacterium]
MSLLEVIVLGLVQGLTEFIPISSSGHLVVAQTLFGSGSDHLFLEAINIGTFLALVVYFFPKIMTIVRLLIEKREGRLVRNILITSVPAGLVGYVAADFISGSAFFGSIIVVMGTLLVVGILMIILEKLPRLSEARDGEALSAGRAFLVGIAQMLALIPGVSRSGSTIIAGRLLGLNPKEAAEYSFLASLPIMAGVTLKVFLTDGDYLAAHATDLVIGNIVAFLSGLMAVSFLMRYLAYHDLRLFGWYRVALAAIIGVTLLVQL